MHADGVERDRNACPIAGDHDALLREQRRLLGGFFDSEKRASDRARHERSVGVVAPVGERLANHGRAGGAGSRCHLRRVAADDGEVGIDCPDRLDDDARQHDVFVRVVVERTVRFDVAHWDAFTAGNFAQGFDLFNQRRAKRRRRQRHRCTAEICAVGIGRMRPDRHLVAFGAANSVGHRLRVADVTAARDVGRRNHRPHLLLTRRAFGDVGTEINHSSAPFVSGSIHTRTAPTPKKSASTAIADPNP